MHANKNVPVYIMAAGLGLAGVILLLVMAASGSPAALAQAGPGAVQPLQATQTVTPTATATPAVSLFLPLMRVYKTPEVTLLKAWTSETLDGKLQAYLPGMPMFYQTNGLNNLAKPAKIGLQWQQSGPCAAGQVFSGTLSILPGEWSHYLAGLSPECTGVFTATANMAYTNTDTSLEPRFVVNQPGTVRVNLQQGFDRCYHPDIDDMQVWWDKSPYVVFNLYIGGVSYACKNKPLDAVYVRQLAEQGWWFIPTWVGPQAPCSKYLHKMSSDRETAYIQGKLEALDAMAAAEELGLFGQKVIYYDLESYTGDEKCRNTVKAFMRGWTEQLQDLGNKAGAYGAACRSYIADWATNVPPPDDIWIAHWYLTRYDPDATVWNAVCLDDPAPFYWLHNQRIRQYAGGHSETWGGVPLTIDSNVLEGEVTFLPVETPAAAKALGGAQVEAISPVLRDVQLIDGVRGWLLADDSRLLWTQDGGDTWRDISPEVFQGGRILDAGFVDGMTGWAIGLPAGELALTIAHTVDGGEQWVESQLALTPQEVAEIASAYLEALDGGQVFVALKLQSGSSFSRGRLFASPDGGMVWKERFLPLGEPVAFLDARHGWTAGGAAGDALYYTDDGGYTWQEQDLGLAEAMRVEIGLPQFNSDGQGWLPVRLHESAESRLQVYVSHDGGRSWSFQEAAHSQEVVAGMRLDRLMAGMPQQALEAGEHLPQETIAADISSSGIIWAITQNGSCEEGAGADSNQAVRCVQGWMLLRSADGGQTWEEIPVNSQSG